jgi:hypothetical protein
MVDALSATPIFAKCAICRSSEPGKNKVGPSLFAVVGGKAASLAGYDYFDAMQQGGWVWDAETLDRVRRCRQPRWRSPASRMPRSRSDRLSRDASNSRPAWPRAVAGSWSVLPMLLSIAGGRGLSRSQRRFAT